MSEPDFKKLQDVGQRLRDRVREGGITHGEYAELLDEARKAVGDRTEFLEGILMQGAMLGFAFAG